MAYLVFFVYFSVKEGVPAGSVGKTGNLIPEGGNGACTSASSGKLEAVIPSFLRGFV